MLAIGVFVRSGGMKKLMDPTAHVPLARRALV